MAKKNIVDVDFSVLKDVLTKMRKAKENLKSPSLTKMGSYSKLNVDEQINNALDKLSIAIDETIGFINTTELSKLVSKLIEVDQKGKNKIKKPTNTKPSTTKTSSTTSSSSSSSKKKTTKQNLVLGTKVKSLVLEPLLPNLIVDTNAIIKPTVNIRIQELENLENYLKSGDLASATSSYDFLKALGNEKEANELLSKYGYKVTTENGKTVISKITNDTTTDNSNTNNQTNNTNEGEVIATETPTTDNSNNQTTTIVENNPSNQETTKNNQTSSNNTNYSNSNNQTVVENTSTNTEETSTTIPSETPPTTDKTTEVPDSIKDSTKSDKKTNVVSITDDSKTTTTKKSSGLGTAIPIGLGTIATGAAAVAGVRYVKNRHDNQEEYDESYDDENNNLDNDGEYVDTAQYDSGESYMDDDYLGPKDNNVSSEDSYVDPEDLEEIDNFSDDAILEDLNSNY